MEGRRRHSGPRADQPHQSGPAALVSADRHQCEGGKTLPLDDRPPLDTLGAITKGQRQTGGQGLFRPEDNLESFYARDALRQLYLLLVNGKVENCSLKTLRGGDGSLP